MLARRPARVAWGRAACTSLAVRHCVSARAAASRSCSAPAAPAPAPASAQQQHTPRRDLLLLGLAAAAARLAASDIRPCAASAAEGRGIDTVFVAGATGKTGRRAVQQLRAAGYRVRAGVRDVRKAQSLGFALDSGITVVQADVTKGRKALEAAIGDAQAVVCVIGGASLVPGAVKAVEEQGVADLVDAAKARGVKAFVLQTSLLTNAAAVGQQSNPNYRFLNLFGGVLDRKLAAERYLQASGLTYTVVRPGGLSDKPPSEVGQLLVSGPDTLFGLDTDAGRSISRDTVAAVLVAALRQPAAANKVVEIVAAPDAPGRPEEEWFCLRLPCQG